MFRKFFPYLILTIGVFALLISGYYFFAVRSKRVLVEQLYEMHVVVSGEYYDLLQLNLNMEELRGLDASSNDFHSRRIVLVKSSVEVLNQASQKELEKIPRVNLLGHLYYLNPARRTNSDLVTPSEGFVEQSRGIIEKQREFYQELDDYYVLVERIYAYNPQSDLGTLNPETQTGEIIRRLKSADEGLEHIKGNLIDSKLNVDVSDVVNQINATQENVNTVINAVEGGGDVSEGVGDIATAFEELKRVTFRVERDMIESQKDLWIEQEEITRALKKLLDEIEGRQATLIES